MKAVDPNAPEGLGIRSIPDLVRVCVGLGALRIGGISHREWSLVEKATTRTTMPELVQQARLAIASGRDPLGDAFCRLRHAMIRRRSGAFYTPVEFVRAIVKWTKRHYPSRVVDVGCGSGRFSRALVGGGYSGHLIAIDNDPVATLMTRAVLATVRTSGSIEVVNESFLSLNLPAAAGATAFIGNPPFLRHQSLSRAAKAWGKKASDALDIHVNGLAGLHVLFMMNVALLARKGDVMCFLTPAEWLEAPSNSELRRLLLDTLGCIRIDEIDRRVKAFPDAFVSSAIVSAKVGSTRDLVVRRVSVIANLKLAGGEKFKRAAMAKRQRWSSIESESKNRPCELTPLSTYARVHRGIATGANDYFVVSAKQADDWDLTTWVIPCFRRAAEVVRGGGIVRASDASARLLVLPPTLESPSVAAYIALGEKLRLNLRNLCGNRTPWWAIKLPERAPEILVTYMGRRPPRFAANPDGCHALNVLHGIYFNDPVSDTTVERLVAWLNSNGDSIDGGRTYHGGLRKFEPRDLERILVPHFDSL